MSSMIEKEPEKQRLNKIGKNNVATFVLKLKKILEVNKFFIFTNFSQNSNL